MVINHPGDKRRPTQMSRKPLSNERGFTVIELISTLVIISVLAAVLIPRYIDADTSAKMLGIDMGVAELNGRETLTWAMVKLSNTGYQNDGQVWAQLVVNPGTVLGPDYKWPIGPPGSSGGTLQFKDGVQTILMRSGSNTETPGKWRR